MNPLRYKTLLTVLPGMATVVNAFDSPQVQSAVYELLIEALESKLVGEGYGRNNGALVQEPPRPVLVNGEVTHDLIEGESIHTDQQSRPGRSTTTVF